MSAFHPSCGAPSCDLSFFAFPVYVSMLTLEDGTIVAEADTYALAATISTYATRYGFDFTGTDLAHEQAILRAMIYIESFEPVFAGERVSLLQELSWPRNYVPNALKTGYIANNTIPAGIVNALSEAAIAELATPGVLTADRSSQNQGVVKVRKKLGPLESEVEYAGGTSLDGKIYTRIIEFLRPYLKTASSRYSVRGH